MSENETKNEDFTNEEVEVEVEETDVVREEATEDDTETETQDERDAKIEKLEKQVKTLKIQKAKKSEKMEKAQEEAPIKGDMTAKDMFALMNAKVTEAEDIDAVTEYAKFKNIGVDEALKSNVVQTILSEKQNERKVASATNTGNGRRGSSEVSVDVLIANANKGKMPESEADMDRLIEAQMTRRK